MQYKTEYIDFHSRQLLMHLIHTGTTCEAETRLKLGERCFAFAGPAARNSLPTSLHEITNHKPFKRERKTSFLSEHSA